MYLAQGPKRMVVQGGTAQKAAYAWVNYLNDVLTMDPEFLSALIQMRVKCGTKIAMHPTLQVINLNQMDEVLAPPPPPPKPTCDPDLPVDWQNPYPPIKSVEISHDLETMTQPRWVAGVLGLINGFIGVSETGKGPVDAIIDLETNLIIEFVVSDPYKKRKD